MKSKIFRLLFFFLFLAEVSNSFSQSAGKIFSQGKDAAEQGKTDDAIALFTKVLEMKPNDDEVMIERGKQYEKKKEFAKAIDDYDKALIIHADNKIYLRAAALKI
ncbi:MAG: tetratricopeptide repeat protein, partial [Bacteroidia bacterium]